MKILFFVKRNILLITVLLLAFFLRFDRVGSFMPFIGDQGWFYLSARDMLVNQQVPLVGITSSHTWLHQGPLWTYILAAALFLGKFNPISGAVLSGFLGLFAVFLTYKIGEDFFSRRMGVIAAFLMATSPLVIIHDRMPYHTAPIAFIVSLLIYSILAWTRGKQNFFPVVCLSISLLYNFELATVVFVPVVLFFLFYGLYKKEKWVKALKNKKIITASFLCSLIPMIPILIYDVQSGFPQTVKYAGWFIYKAGQLVGLYKGSTGGSLSTVIGFFFSRYQIFSFMPSLSISALVFASSIYVVARDGIKKITSVVGIILLSTLVPFLGFILSKTSSEAYIPMLFPGLVLSIAYLFNLFFQSKYKSLAFLALIIICVTNSYSIFEVNYLAGTKGGFGPSLESRILASKKIIKLSDNKSFSINFKGPGSEFASSTMNYEYLIWWLSGKRPTKNGVVKIEISEPDYKIIVKRTF